MGSNKKIGFYWGDDRITLVEVEKNSPTQITHLPLSSKDAESPISFDLTEEIRIVAIIQKALRDLRIETKEAYLSLPMKDIILRTFIVPWVKSAELKAVVEFEAKKYIPFDIKEVHLLFHSVAFTENKIKKMRIILYAVRKDVIERYERIFQQAGMQIVLSEPSAMSLAKSLLSKREININDRLAFLHLYGQNGRIFFFDRGVPQFIRDFQTSYALDVMNTPTENAPSSEDLSKIRTLNEVRNSFDFYSRQFNIDKIETMFIYGPTQQQEFLETEALDLGVNFKRYGPSMMNSVQISNMEDLYAIGVCMDHPSALPLLNFSQSSVRIVTSLSFGDFASVFKVLGGCALVLIIAFAAAQFREKQMQLEEVNLENQQGQYAGSSEDSIKEQIQKNTIKLAGYKAIRYRSRIHAVLSELAVLIPEAIWIKSLNIHYVSDQDSGFVVEIEGSAYKSDATEQIRTINDFVLALKREPKLKKYFKKANLTSFQRQTTDGHLITDFVIKCS